MTSPNQKVINHTAFYVIFFLNGGFQLQTLVMSPGLAKTSYKCLCKRYKVTQKFCHGGFSYKLHVLLIWCILHLYFCTPKMKKRYSKHDIYVFIMVLMFVCVCVCVAYITISCIQRKSLKYAILKMSTNICILIINKIWCRNWHNSYLW